jgi:hypothetical protein
MMFLGALLTVMLVLPAPPQASPQVQAPPTADQARAALADGRPADAWAIVGRLPVEPATVALAVELALSQKTRDVDIAYLPLLADRTARLTLLHNNTEHRLDACAVVVRMTSDAGCADQMARTLRGADGTTLDRARLWVTMRLLGEQPAALPAGWESAITGSSALEVASWSEVPAASRVRLLEPLIASPDMGTQISALATLQLVPGPDALALWRRLAAAGSPSYMGAKTQIVVGLARHGDPESLKTLAPHEGMLSVADRMVLALGRVERKDPQGRAALVSLVNIGAEHEAVIAAEALAALGQGAAVESRVRTWIADGSAPLRARFLALAARLNLGRSAAVVRHLTSDDEAVRVAAGVAVAAAAKRAP